MDSALDYKLLLQIRVVAIREAKLGAFVCVVLAMSYLVKNMCIRIMLSEVYSPIIQFIISTSYYHGTSQGAI